MPGTVVENWCIFISNAHKGRRQCHPTLVPLPGKSHGWRSLVGCSPWGAESDTIERLHFHFLLSCIGEGNGNPLQCSCLKNPGTGEPGGLPSMGLHIIGHNWSDLAAAVAMLTKAIKELVFLLKRWGYWGSEVILFVLGHKSDKIQS